MSLEPTRTADERRTAYGQDRAPTLVDRFGVWLSSRQIRRFVPSFRDLRIADIGCGYHAKLVRPYLADVREATLIDVSLAPDLKTRPRVRAIEGHLPTALEHVPDAGVDVALCTSVLEHLWEPLDCLRHMRRMLAPGGIALVNVPSWSGKRYLEFSAFRLGLSPVSEMDDHKMYYDIAGLWPLLVRAGFTPSHIRCFTHKFGMNVFAACQVER
ncbi:MAG: class I SAM-dependent methyltransferase [Acidobacteriia bacterium]|nr:class I SAM-dependent methyltransferase [Terriglobia bacterium]